MSWCRATLRGVTVYARCDAGGRLAVEQGRVEIRYRRGPGPGYRASPANLEPEQPGEILPDEIMGGADPAPASPVSKKGRSSKQKTGGGRPAVPENGSGVRAGGATGEPVYAYTDGACSGNPGPAGLGVILLDGERRRELSLYLGEATNNIAELTAIEQAAGAMAGTRRPVVVYTDSQYCIGVLTRGWKAKANRELVARVKTALAALADVSVRYVPGHAGQELNERADQLARQAVEERRSTGWVG